MRARWWAIFLATVALGWLIFSALYQLVRLWVRPCALAALLLAPLGAWAEGMQASDPQVIEPSNGAVPVLQPAECDPAKMACLTVEKWALALRAWSPGATDPRDLAGGRLQAELRRGRWRVQARLDGTATSGAYKAGDWSTVRDVEAHAAVVYDLLRLPQGISVGPMAAIGGAAALPEDGIRASLGRSVTAVLGVAGSWRGGRIHFGIGQAHPLDRGLAMCTTWQIPLSDRTASLGYVAIGRRHVPATEAEPAHSTEAIVAWVGLGIKL